MGKIRREWRRLAGRFRGALAYWPERLAQRRADAAFPSNLLETPGDLAAGPKLAIFVLWQPGGVAASTFHTCRHLSANGYAPMVVSNAPLSEADRAALAGMCWRVIERPNRGHDFGAWRDGIRLLRLLGLSPVRLLLLNDSIWFPLRADCGLLSRLERASGFTGAVWMERPGRAHAAHVQSWLMAFGPKALAHPAFARFWDGYRVSSRRAAVLERGEKGLSRAMRAAGLIVQPDLSPARLQDHAQGEGDAELARILTYAAFPDPARAALRDRLLAGQRDAGFRPAALALISRSLMSGPYLETHPYLADRACGLPALKKRREPVSTEGRRQFLRAVEAGDLPAPQPMTLDEIRARDR